ncbi:MAG: ABC transporter ATP-binding protein [Congregibacter sp.]
MLLAQAARKTFDNLVALEGLDLEVKAGETLCLLGANGAGKTTTMNLFMGFYAPDSGSVSVAGVSPTQDPATARQQLAYIPENVALYPNLTGLENLRFFDELAGHKRDADALVKILVDAGLTAEQTARPVASYSKGLTQKVGLAIAFAKEARALLLDEPMSGLDPKAASEFTARIREFQASGCAVLIATHDIFRAKECASKIGIMRAGRLMELMDASQVGAQEIERIYLNHLHEDIAA